MAQKWDEEQDRALVEHAHEGVASCRAAIFEECGVLRSEAAVQRRGSRLGVGFGRLARCESCGGWFPLSHIRKGRCRLCNRRALVADWEERVRQAEDNAARDSSRELDRRYDALRQKRHRRGPKEPPADGQERLC